MKTSGNIISLVPLSLDIELDLKLLRESVQRQFKSDLSIYELPFDLGNYFNPDRLQYSANDILQKLLESVPDEEANFMPPKE